MDAVTRSALDQDGFAEEIVDPDAHPRLDPRLSVRGRPARIMLAEDDAEMRSLLSAGLRQDGYEVCATQNGLEMVEEIRLHLFSGDPVPVDLIISDERMPGMFGLEFLTVLREAEWPTPFILITGFGDDRTHERAHNLGASAVLDKPFDIDELRRIVLTVLAGRGADIANAAPAGSAPARAGENSPRRESP